MTGSAAERVVVTTHRVIYGDTDAMGVVYYGTYLRFLEVGRAEFLRARGKPYAEVEAEGALFPVSEVQMRYRAPARYDDLLQILVWVGELGRASVRFDYRLTREPTGEPIAEGWTRHPCVDARSRKVIRMPAALHAVLAGEGPEADSTPA